MAGHRGVTAGAIGALVAAGLVTAFAASLTVSGGPLASGRADTPCDANGVGVVQKLSGTNVASFDVTGIDVACAGSGVKVTIRNGSAAQASGGPVTVPGGGGTVNVPVSPAVALTDTHSVAVLILGP